MNQVKDFEDGMLKYMRANHASLLQTIGTEGDLSDASDAAVKEAVTTYMTQFQAAA